MSKSTRVVILGNIITTVCAEWGVQYSDVCSTMSDGRGPINLARNIVVYLASPYAEMHELGALLGRRQSTSLYTSRRNLMDKMERDDELAARVGNLKIQLGLIS